MINNEEKKSAEDGSVISEEADDNSTTGNETNNKNTSEEDNNNNTSDNNDDMFPDEARDNTSFEENQNINASAEGSDWTEDTLTTESMTTMTTECDTVEDPRDTLARSVELPYERKARGDTQWNIYKEARTLGIEYCPKCIYG